MKLLFISQYFPPETGAGATRASSLQQYLTEQGWEVDILCEKPNYPSGIIPGEYKKPFFHISKNKSGKIIRTWVIPTRRENFIQQIVMFGSFFLGSLLYGIMHPKKYDAVYATSPPIFGALSGLLLSRLYRVPFFFEVRDLWPDAAIETGHIKKSNFIYKVSKWLERLLYRKADRIIPVTKRSEDLIKKTYPQAETFVIYNGVDTEHFKPVADPRYLIDEPLDSDLFRIGYVGTIGVIHDLATIIKAAKLLEQEKDIEIVIVGDGSKSIQLKALLEEHNPSNVKWVGIKEHHKIPAYISSLDLGLNPVHNTKVFESIITVKFFEYLACEVPVITMANGLLEEVGKASGAAVTLEPENPELLADTIRMLKNNPDKREKLKSHSRAFVLKHFDRKKWAITLSDMLKARLESPGTEYPPDSEKKEFPEIHQNQW